MRSNPYESPDSPDQSSLKRPKFWSIGRIIGVTIGTFVGLFLLLALLAPMSRGVRAFGVTGRWHALTILVKLGSRF